MRPAVRRLLLGAIIVALVGVAAVGMFRALWQPLRITDDEVRRVVHATLQREAPASFLVTGELDLTATATVHNTRYLRLLRLSLGTSSATVRVPARASYGFDVRALQPEMIQVLDSVVEVRLPPLRIYAVDANLAGMEVRTERGWARVSGAGEASARDAALESVDAAMRAQAAAYLEDSAQPRVNTARALELMLTPALQAAGLEQPRFRFILGGRLRVEPEGR
ncbi:MAG TPA: DUF4230 domain-containing protein [Longimicrobiales bacterium]|nr:DUF4230 domain-containing protein [Longimicrobiales bacterium]